MNKIYYVTFEVNRGKLFIDDCDFLRFCDYLYYFNNDNSAPYQKLKKINQKNQKKLVEIIFYCLTEKGFYLITKSEKETNIDRFIKKIKTGYAMYFNKKYQIKGPLFVGHYYRKEKISLTAAKHLSKNIHLRPIVDLYYNKGSVSAENAIKFILSYPWSSLKHHLGITKNDLLSENIGVKINTKEHESYIKNFLSSEYQ